MNFYHCMMTSSFDIVQGCTLQLSELFPLLHRQQEGSNLCVPWVYFTLRYFLVGSVDSLCRFACLLGDLM